jgi:hypothetical protein
MVRSYWCAVVSFCSCRNTMLCCALVVMHGTWLLLYCCCRHAWHLAAGVLLCLPLVGVHDAHSVCSWLCVVWALVGMQLWFFASCLLKSGSL